MEGGEDMMEQVFYAEAQTVEIALRLGRKVRVAGCIFVAPDNSLAKPSGEQICASLNQMQ